MDNVKLYELDQAYQHLLDECREYASEHDGEIEAGLSMRLEAVEMAREVKIENTLKYYKNENAVAVMLMHEIDALSKRLKTHENNADWTKGYLAAIVKPGEKIELGAGRISWRESVSTNILDFSKIPAKYKRIIPAREEPDKLMIKDDLKQGIPVDGAELLKEHHLQIK